MSAPLSKELREKYNVRLSTFEFPRGSLFHFVWLQKMGNTE